MKVDWAELRQELAVWRAQGRALPIWWRDDDAVAVTPALEQLLGLAETLEVPVHLAIIPAMAEADLAARLRAHPLAVPMVHGWAHLNHAPAGAKKAEFGHPRADATAELALGLARMNTLFPVDNISFFVPPWNRIDHGLISVLPAAGYAGLSTFTPRTATYPAEGLLQINTHLDPIFWRNGGGLVPPDQLITRLVKLLRDRREGHTDEAEPLGILTHHLVHDPAIWNFTKACLTELLNGGAVAVSLRDMV